MLRKEDASWSDDCPVLPEITYILTLLGLICTPAAIISVAGFVGMALLGEPVMPVTWIMEVGFAACAGAAIWSNRRCRGLSWNLVVQTVLALIGSLAGAFTWHAAQEPLVVSLAMLMFYPAVLLALHGLWNWMAYARRKKHG